jgi:hypothetical protein
VNLITLFTAPKPFVDPRIALIQRNAIESWTHLPDVEVLLMGDEPGLPEVAAAFGVKHVSAVGRNASGTPLVSSMVRLARQTGSGDLLCIANSDMILMADFVIAARALRSMKDRFVLVGRRWDFDVRERIQFGTGWQEKLRADVLKQGFLHRPAGSDVFLFPTKCYPDLPDFAVGRAGWDNWMIFKARKESWPVVDGTESIMLVHQNHDYSHLPGGEPHYSVPESQENIRLAGGDAPVRYTILDATSVLRGNQLCRPPWSLARAMRSAERLARATLFFLPHDLIEEVARPKRWKKRIRKWFLRR